MVTAGPLVGLCLFAAVPQQGGPLHQRLEECDAVTFAADPSERDYTCYGKAAREFSWREVAPHLRNQAEEHPDDGQLWLALGAAEGDFDDDPKPSLRRAIAALEAEGKAGYQIQAQLNLVRRLRDDGQTEAAASVLEAAQLVADRLNHPIYNAIVVFERSTGTGQLLDADLVTAYRESVAVYDALPENSPYQVRASGLSTIARIARAQGRFSEAQRRSSEGAALARSVDDHHSSLFGDIAAARDALALGGIRHDPAAEDVFRNRVAGLVSSARAHENPRAELSSLISAARAGRGAARLPLWERCEALATKLHAAPAQQTCAVGRTVVLLESDPPQANTVSAEILAGAIASESPNDLAEAYQLRGRVLWTLGRLDDAWTAWESMLDASEASESKQSSEDGAARLHAQWVARYKLMVGSALAVQSDPQTWQARAFEVMERMRGRQANRLFANSGVPPLPNPGRATLGETQAALGSDEAILVFQLGHERTLSGAPGGGSWVLAIERHRVRAYALGDGAGLTPKIEMVGAAFAGATEEGSVDLGAPLFELLLAGPLDALDPGVRSITFVPDGALHRLPFAALGPMGGPPLTADFATATIPSVRLWLQQQRGSSTRPVRRTLLGFADPSPSSVLPAEWNGRPAPRLPGARAEVMLAAETLGAPGSTYFGADASETALREVHADGVLHIAAHAIVDHEHPENAAVLLAADNVHDGSVEMADLASLDLVGSIVVLAACQGADGEVLAGEGALSPARALFLSGARAVVASLWPVRDDEAAAFFAEFYPRLDEGASVAEAVAYARNERRLAGAAPSAWGGFIVYGDGGATLAPRSGFTPAIWVLLWGALAGLGGWWASGFRRRDR